MLIKSFAIVPLLATAGFHSGAFAQTISPNGVVNAASLQPAVAPGSVISILGTSLAASTIGSSSVPLPTTLGGTSVLVNGTPAPLFFVSPSQINAQLPYEIQPGQATLVVAVNGSSSAPAPFAVSVSAPAIMVYGSNRAVALTQDPGLNGPDRPALVGSAITVFMVGQGPVDSLVTSGAGSPANPVAQPILPVTATIGGRPADVLFAGLLPGAVGLFQVDLRIPNLAAGDFPLVITIGDASSNPALIAVSTPGQAPRAASIVRTIAYHQLTSLPDAGPDNRSSTVLSGNGAVIAYTYAPASTKASNPNRIFVMNFDGSGARQIDSYTSFCYCGSTVDISDDGTKVVSTEGRQVRIVDEKGARALVTVDTGVSGIRIEGDGRRVFFLLDRDGSFVAAAGSSPAQRGLYVINADGSGLRHIVGPAAVAALFGSTANSSISPEFTVTGNSPSHSLGVSKDGARIVFGARKTAGSRPDAIFGVNLDGSGLHFVIGPVPYVEHLAISSDGSKVLYDTYEDNLVETGSVNFDGSGRRALRHDGLGNSPGVQLSADGSLLLAFDILYNTDGSGALQLSTPFNALTPGRPVMNATGTRFVYPFVLPGTYSQGLSQLASAEINPLNLGVAPVVVNPAVNPGFVIPGDSPAAVTAGVNTANRILGVSYSTVRDGMVDDPVTGSVFLADDGTNGDQTAGDGIFTSTNVVVGSRAPTGPRTLRLFAQVLDTAGLRHGTLVDVAPFFVLSQKPTGLAPQLSGLNASSGAAGSQMTITGSGFDPLPANNQVIVGSRIARVVSASPSQLLILIPSDLPAGPAPVVVASQGQTSNAIPFTLK